MKIVMVFAVAALIALTVFLTYKYVMKRQAMRAADPDSVLSRRQRRELRYRRARHDIDEDIADDLERRINPERKD